MNNGKADSRLQKILSQGHFAVTAECGPPRGADAQVIRRKGELLRGVADAVNVTDNQTSIVRMSSLAACLILQEMGLEPNLQMVTRDRNRIALQSDLLGAYALGIRNVLCLSGDHQSFGSEPQCRNVFDIDSIQLIQVARRMRDEGRDAGGYELKEAPRMFIGAAANPFADPFEFRVIRLGKKVKAGANFVQTQCVYNLKRFAKFMEMVRDRGLDQKVYILAGITPLRSVGMARYMKEKVAGMDIPDELIARMKGVPKERAVQEGLDIAQETIAELQKIKGVHGVHIMAIEAEDQVGEIVKRAGLLPRPEIAPAEANHAQKVSCCG